MKSRCILGHGDYLEFVFHEWKQSRPDESLIQVEVRQFDNYSFDLSIFDQLNPNQYAMFIAVNEQFGNFKRKELMQVAIERGFQLDPFVHSSASLGADVVVGPNVFIGANSIIELSSRIDFNTVINSNVIVGAHSRIKASCWIESGVQLGKKVDIGANSIVRMGSLVSSGVKIGRCCELGWPRMYSQDVKSRTIFDIRYDNPIFTYES